MKTRHQSKVDYCITLQKEYFIHYLRARIYPDLKDKNYHKRVMEKKKEKALDIAKEFGMPTIFDDQDLYNEIRSQIIPAVGELNFEGVTEKDNRHYFTQNVDVVFVDEGRRIVGKIIKSNHKQKVAQVKIRKSNVVKPCFYKALTRVL